MIPGHVADTLKRHMSIKKDYASLSRAASSQAEALIHPSGSESPRALMRAGGTWGAAAPPVDEDPTIEDLELRLSAEAAICQSSLRPPSLPKAEGAGGVGTDGFNGGGSGSKAAGVSYKQWHPSVSILFAGRLGRFDVVWGQVGGLSRRYHSSFTIVTI